MMPRVFARLVFDAALVSALLGAGAGTMGWSRAWWLVAVMLAVRTASAVAVQRVSPALLAERAAWPVHAGQAARDRVLVVAVLATGFLGLPLVAALDVWRWRPGPALDARLAPLGLLAFALGWALKGVALYTNAHAVPTVRLQAERAHRVVDTGVYAWIRHPFYAADPLIHVGLALWLGSAAAAVAAVVPIGLMLVRLQHEEAVLRAGLPGYAGYVARVPYRLVPGVW